MLCLTGEPDQLPFLPAIASLGASLELGSYGLVGIRSAAEWENRLALHRAVRACFDGPIALHGPFIGMEYAHPDYLIRQAINQRLDMIFAAAVELGASRVVLHSGYKRESELFGLQELWLERNAEFWQAELPRWASAGVEIVLENECETDPDMLVRLVNTVNHPSLGLCLDTGHAHLFSELELAEWVRRMGRHLYHVHIHDNDRSGDRHWPPGRGTIDFESFFAAVTRLAPNITLSLEVEDSMEVKLAELHKLAEQFG